MTIMSIHKAVIVMITPVVCIVNSINWNGSTKRLSLGMYWVTNTGSHERPMPKDAIQDGKLWYIKFTHVNITTF